MEKNGKKKAKKGGTLNFRLRMRAPEVTISSSFPVATSVMRYGTTTIVSSTNVPVAQAHAITPGSTTTSHHKYDFVRTHILLMHYKGKY